MLRAALGALGLSWALAWFLGRGFDPRSWLWLARDAEVVLSAAELSRYTGAEDSAGLYLAVLGQVFDVQRGRKHYGPSGAYSFFAGTFYHYSVGIPSLSTLGRIFALFVLATVVACACKEV